MKESYHRIPPRDFYCRLESIPIPKTVKAPFAALILKWIKCNGPLWTVARVKLFREELLQEVAGSGKGSYPWFAKTRAGSLRAVWGTLRALALQGESLEAVLYLLNSVTAWEQRVLVRNQIDEILETIQPPGYTSKPVWSSVKRKVFTAFRKLPVHRPLRVGWPVPLLQCPPGSYNQLLRLTGDIKKLATPFIFCSDADFELLKRALGGRVMPPWSSTDNLSRKAMLPVHGVLLLEKFI